MEGKRQIGYCTDVEGDWNFFVRYIRNSSVLFINDELKFERFSSGLEEDCSISLRENSTFVFGGDAIDRGNGDLRVIRSLLQLHEKYTNRVFLILGNRDVNKLLFSEEFNDGEFSEEMIHEFKSPFWFPDIPTFPQFIQTLNNFIPSKKNYQIALVKWKLKYFFGCDNTFELRREELIHFKKNKLQNNDNEIFVSDEEVYDELIRSYCSEEGETMKYIRVAKIALVIGNTLFVHGAISKHSNGFIPSPNTPFCKGGGIGTIEGEKYLDSSPISEWVDQINLWKDIQIQNWEEYQRKKKFNLIPLDKSNSKLIESLLSYYYRLVMGKRTCAITIFFSDKGYPKLPQEECTNYLLNNNIQRVIVGHKPVGELPLIMIGTGKESKQVEFISVDTSYSNIKDRGLVAVCEVLILGDPFDNQTLIFGVLNSGEAYSFQLPQRISLTESNEKLDEQHHLIGRSYSDHWWIRAKFAKKDEYVVTQVNKRVQSIMFKRSEELFELLTSTVTH